MLGDMAKASDGQNADLRPFCWMTGSQSIADVAIGDSILTR